MLCFCEFIRVITVRVYILIAGERLNIVEVAKKLKDEDARKILKYKENFPIDWVENAKSRLSKRG